LKVVRRFLVAFFIAGFAAWLGRKRRIRIPQTPEGVRIVVVGGGFGGLSALMELGRVADPRPFEAVLVDQNDYHVFSPLLYQVAAAVVRPSSVAYPLRSIAAGHRFRFVKAQVQGVDLSRRTLLTDRGPISFDFMVLATGSAVQDYGVPGVREHALTLKTLPDAVRIRNRVLEWLEAVDRGDAVHRKLVIVGGGATGVELAGALAALVRDVAGREFPGIKLKDVEIVLLEASSALLYNMPKPMGQLALQSLTSRGVEVMLNARVEAVGPNSVRVAGAGELEAALVIWAGGIKGAPPTFNFQVVTSRDSRVEVDDCLRLPGWENVYVVGDLAWSARQPDAFTASAQAAVQQGRSAGANLIRSLQGLPAKPYKYRHRGDLVIAGRYGAVANVMGLTFDGFPAWALWRLVHLLWLTGLRNRLEVLVDWAFVYLGPRPVIPLEEA
jgi:NADH dehydrogenase